MGRRITVVTGILRAAEPQPVLTDATFLAYTDWQRRNLVRYELRGFWALDKVTAYCDQRGVIIDAIVHRDLGIAGKEWSQGDVRKWAAIGGTLQPVSV